MGVTAYFTRFQGIQRIKRILNSRRGPVIAEYGLMAIGIDLAGRLEIGAPVPVLEGYIALRVDPELGVCSNLFLCPTDKG